MALEPTDLAYAAGVIDGEGCIQIHRSRNNRNGRSYYGGHVSVFMCDRQATDLLHAMFGGSLIHIGSRSHRPACRPGVKWVKAGRGSADVCRVLLPYLRVKREQASLVVEYYSDSRLEHGTSSRVGESEILIRDEFYSRSRDLNRRAA